MVIVDKQEGTLTIDVVDFELFIQSQPFDDGITYDTLEFKIIKNCCGFEETVYKGNTAFFNENANLSVVSNNLVLPIEVFEEDVYTFIFNYETSDGDYYETNVCYFFEENLACRIADYIYNNGSTEASGLYEVLIRANECKCNCDSLCATYKEILKELDGQGECNC